jgi:GH15 family glucan-1,4-alpha-glucosidase
MLFGEHLTKPPEELVALFVRKVANLRPGSRPDRTKAVKQALREIGRDMKFYVAPDDSPVSAPRDPESEFLYDMVWFRNDDANDMVMALESEMDRRSPEEILKDFQKLLHVKAPLKILVFQGVEPEWGENILKGVRDKYLLKFSQHVQGERYIIVEFRFDEDAAHWYQLDIRENGALGDIDLREKGRVAFPPI